MTQPATFVAGPHPLIEDFNMLTTLIGTFLGGVFRMLPEVLKWLDRRDDRAHELAMFDKQLEADKMKGEMQLALAKEQADYALAGAEMQGLIAGVAAQAQLTGNRFVDGINSLMRPIITFWWVIVMYSVALYAQYAVLVTDGLSNIQAIVTLWGPDEKAIVASIVSFWFVDRSLRPKGLR